ncbi:MAG: hypothetical protein COX17_03065 [Deltaproteobacteria bacterium CG23_combo_of_CG06-09_8_20_14_all_60_8]|nr:MAG: hypothetical protein COX17_03065 [Deltaproteobacteria bacterium CG23_combo_of_CG06-09_8_20_14_all_60_8]
MHAPKLAMGPYLKSVEKACHPLPKEELIGIILSLAKEVQGDGRGKFLGNLLAMLPGEAEAHATADASAKADLLSNIAALKGEILERIASIEDGSYWDAQDYDDDEEEEEDYYSDADPDLLGADQQDELAGFFQEADRFFLHGQAEAARTVYGALFDLVEEVSARGYLPDFAVDLREARARYCRCVYDLAGAGERVRHMLAIMAVDRPEQNFDSVLSREYPFLQDVIDAQTGDLADFADFLPAWENALARKGFSQDRLAELRLEAAFFSGDLAKIGELARSWQAKQPLGYLYWLKQLNLTEDWRQMREVAREALAKLTPGEAKEQVANHLITAGQNLGDTPLVLEGKQEQFKANICDANLMALVNEAGRQGKRAGELASIAVLLREQGKKHGDEHVLLAKALLMTGELGQAFLLARNGKEVGWSHGNAAGLLFGAILYLVSGKRADCLLINDLLKWYANQTAVPSHRFSVADESEPSCCEEIRQGLNSCEVPAKDLAEYCQWARTIGGKRINQIVSSKHRFAYDRAAGVLGALAEALEASGQPDKARELLREYFHDRFSRFAAFRREVRTAISRSKPLEKHRKVL